jgi:glutamate racemase
MRILIFDSGIGGLGTAAELRLLMPRADLIYLADDAGFPYGERADADLTGAILRVMAAALHALTPDLVVVACNTASTVALSALRARFCVPFVGCVPPVKWAADISRSRVIGLLATPATVRRPYLQDLTARFAADCTLVSHGAPGLARLAERHFSTGDIDPALLRAEVAGLTAHAAAGRIDAVALGCTHYGRLLPALREVLPEGVAWLDPAPRVARQAWRVALEMETPAREALGGAAFFTGSVPEGMDRAAWARCGFGRLERLVSEVEDPMSVPPRDPMSVPAQDPMSVPAHDPKSVPAHDPMSVPAHDPNSVPRQDPKSVPPHDPMSVPPHDAPGLFLKESMRP